MSTLFYVRRELFLIIVSTNLGICKYSVLWVFFWIGVPIGYYEYIIICWAWTIVGYCEYRLLLPILLFHIWRVLLFICMYCT